MCSEKYEIQEIEKPEFNVEEYFIGSDEIDLSEWGFYDEDTFYTDTLMGRRSLIEDYLGAGIPKAYRARLEYIDVYKVATAIINGEQIEVTDIFSNLEFGTLEDFVNDYYQ